MLLNTLQRTGSSPPQITCLSVGSVWPRNLAPGEPLNRHRVTQVSGAAHRCLPSSSKGSEVDPQGEDRGEAGQRAAELRDSLPVPDSCSFQTPDYIFAPLSF